jgi:hypothetical protein
MNAKIDGKNLILTIPINTPLSPSKSGKSLLVDSTHGNVPSTAIVEGKPLIVSLNAYIKTV